MLMYSPKAENSFHLIKVKMISASVLAPLDFQVFEIDTDAPMWVLLLLLIRNDTLFYIRDKLSDACYSSMKYKSILFSLNLANIGGVA